MRMLDRNRRSLWYANPEGSEPILDEWGNDTLEVRKIYTEPKLVGANVSAGTGQDTTMVFGNLTSYNRVIALADNSLGIVEGTRVWFGIGTDKPHNYEVVKVADSVNGVLLAVREVTVSVENNLTGAV